MRNAVCLPSILCDLSILAGMAHAYACPQNISFDGKVHCDDCRSMCNRIACNRTLRLLPIELESALSRHILVPVIH